MPARKKNKIQKARRHGKNGGHSEQANRDRAEIKKIVGTIPAWIMKEGYFNKTDNTPDSQMEKIADKEIKSDEVAGANDFEEFKEDENYPEYDNDAGEENNESEENRNPAGGTPMVITHPNKIIWLWTGVSIVTLMVFAIWIFNIRNIFYDVRNSQGFEETLLTNSRQDFADIWKSIQANDEKINEQLKKEPAAATTTVDQALEDLLKEITAPTAKTVSTTIE